MSIKDEGSKGISPLIATVLLVAFTVAVFGVIITWGTDFISSTTGIVSNKTDTELTCISAGVSLSRLSYCNHYLSGTTENTGMVTLSNMILTVIHSNATTETLRLNETGGGFMQMSPGELEAFNVSIGGGTYSTIRISTSTCPGVSDSAQSSEVTAC